MLVYKVDVLEKLKAKGYSTYKLQSQKLLPQGAMQKIRNGEMVGIIVIDKICSLLQMQPGSIIGWQPDEAEQTE